MQRLVLSVRMPDTNRNADQVGTIAENLCTVSFVVYCFLTCHVQTNILRTFKYFIDTQYRLLTFLCTTSMYYLFCDKKRTPQSTLHRKRHRKRHYNAKDTIRKISSTIYQSTRVKLIVQTVIS